MYFFLGFLLGLLEVTRGNIRELFFLVEGSTKIRVFWPHHRTDVTVPIKGHAPRGAGGGGETDRGTDRYRQGHTLIDRQHRA